MSRYLSVRVEVEIPDMDDDAARAVGETLAMRTSERLERELDVVRIAHAAAVVRRTR